MQIGLSTLLVVGAGLLIQTFANLSRLDPGFDPENLLLFRLNAAQAGYSGQQLVEFYENARRSVAAIPGVHAVSFSDVPLVAGESTVSTVSVAGRTDADKRLQVFRLVVGDSFFSTMGIHLLLGRDFTEMDADPGTRVMVVNESFARVLFPGENPVGQSFSSGRKDYQIVGVCNDAKYQSLRDVAQPVMYFPYRQHIADATCFEVRSVLPALSLVWRGAQGRGRPRPRYPAHEHQNSATATGPVHRTRAVGDFAVQLPRPAGGPAVLHRPLCIDRLQCHASHGRNWSPNGHRSTTSRRRLADSAGGNTDGGGRRGGRHPNRACPHTSHTKCSLWRRTPRPCYLGGCCCSIPRRCRRGGLDPRPAGCQD